MAGKGGRGYFSASMDWRAGRAREAHSVSKAWFSAAEPRANQRAVWAGVGAEGEVAVGRKEGVLGVENQRRRMRV